MAEAKLPDWLRRPMDERVSRGDARKATGGVNTVCEGALCPNRGVCLGENNTATFLIMGPGCSRDCAFCSVETVPSQLDSDEPGRVAEAVKELGLKYVVITSTTRDDIDDGGASHFAATIDEIHNRIPGVPIEVLVPDFAGDLASVDTILEKNIAVFGHNIETVWELYDDVRVGADYERSLSVLEYAAKKGAVTKSAIILGMGECDVMVKRTVNDLLGGGVRLLTIGQYLRPTTNHLPVDRYIPPDDFEEWRDYALKLGFAGCVAGPFVRSSFKAGEMYATLRGGI